jgi:hypothetical protein
MDSVKYIGMDVHQETISIAVRNSSGKLVMECVIETKASTILQFFQGLNGNLQVTFEEGTWAAWLYDLLKRHVTELVVCNPRKNALLKEGSKSDRIDARKLAELLRNGSLSAVYHGEHGLRMLKIVDEILPEWDDWKLKAMERTKRFIDKALDSYEYALDEETDGRRASEFLIAKGIIENPKVQLQLSKASEVDRRTPEEK